MALVKTTSPQGAAIVSEIILTTLQTPNKLYPLLSMSGKLTEATKQDDGTLRTNTNSPIVAVCNGELVSGDTIKVHVSDQLYGPPFVGGEYFEGKGKEVSYSEHELRLQYNEFVVKSGDMNKQLKAGAKMKLSKNAFNQAVSWACGFFDQTLQVRLAGARGFEINQRWSVPLAGTEDWNKIYSANPVTPPAAIRHFVVDGSNVKRPATSGGEYSIASTDVMNLSALEELVSSVRSSAAPMEPCNWNEEGVAPTEEGYYVLMVSEAVYNQLVRSESRKIREFQRDAINRKAQNKHEVFLGGDFYWNGVRVTRMPRPIRFYSGNAIEYCASRENLTATSVPIPAAFAGSNLAVDRSILLGKCALSYGFGSIGQELEGAFRKAMGFLISTVPKNHGMFQELALITNAQSSKISVLSNIGGTNSVIDFGCAVIDSVVPVPSTY